MEADEGVTPICTERNQQSRIALSTNRSGLVLPAVVFIHASLQVLADLRDTRRKLWRFVLS